MPHPGPVSEGQDVVAVPPIVAAKVALYLAMREQGISKQAPRRASGTE